MTTKHMVTVWHNNRQSIIHVEDGANLRKALLSAGLSPYTTITQNLNCGGRGLCATCGVWLVENGPAPQHWHDKAAEQFGYPRLSCQITVRQSMTIQLVADKIIWGGRSG